MTRDSRDLLDLIEQSLSDDQATDVITLNLQGKTSIADYMVVASGRSHRHVGAMADHLRRRLKESEVKGVSVEGETHCDWVLIDAGDILVHLFRPEVREFYKLEKLWGEMPPSANSVGTAAG
ncbi:MAG: ribosome silencing factor [Alphaproteobacteria bacterium]|nr:ribosome silencing factor [Alphaproteobacteria bacterium]